MIRYRTIDKCLQNTYRQWSLEDLIQACSEALYEFEGKDVQVSKRTVQLDLQLMRSDKLGYNAPIKVYQKKYYTYADPDFSITNIPLTKLDMDVLMESVEMLKQFRKFSLFDELNGIILKLEDKIYYETENRKPIIHLDKNENLKGLEHIDILYQAIQKKIVLKLTYQSFTANSPNTFPFHGFILKEFNNRWFLIGKKDGVGRIQTLALDRIRKVDVDLTEDYINEDFDPDSFYKDTYGVTVMSPAQLIEIEMIINAPYVLTKPFHHSQKLIEEYQDGRIKITLRVHHNFEIEKALFAMADSVEILKPITLRNRFQKRFERAARIHSSL